MISILATLAWVPVAQAQVCARVKIEIVQELTLERQAFDAQMRITNGLTNLSIDNIDISVNFQNAAGDPVEASSDPNSTTASFFITQSSTDGVTGGTEGSGSIAADSVGEIRWLIIPAPGAAGPTPEGTLYFVGASVTYSIGGDERTVEVVPDSIYVRPMPLLYLDYFLVEQVHSDNPYTPQVEPAVPFTLGVRVKNDGYGPARSLKINSSQPKIVENELGLLINFLIIGSQVGNEDAAPVLLTDFGDIEAGDSKVARWFMTSTLQGKFVEFSASFSHADELGGELTSLLEEVNTHTLLHDVLVTATGRDDVKDFLADDNGTLRVYESEGVDTEVFDASGVANLTPDGSGGYLLDVGGIAGFFHARVTDPFSGNKSITQVTRTDGKVLDLANAWLSQEWVKASQSYNYFINVFDFENGGDFDYDFDFGGPPVANGAPALGPTPNRSVRVGESLSYTVTAFDPDGSTVILSAVGLPLGATFVDNQDGTGLLSWTPTADQLGSYPIDFGASDGLQFDTSRATVNVVPADATNAAPTSATASLWASKNMPSDPVTPTVVDPDANDEHFFTIAVQPANGTAQVVDNQLVYTPAENYVGTDSFQFEAMDLFGETVIGTASVVVVDGDNLAALGLEPIAPAGSVTSVEVSLDTVGAVASLVPVDVVLAAHTCAGPTVLGTQTVSLPAGPTTLTFPVDLSSFGDEPIVLVATVDAGSAFPETNEFDNRAARGLRVGAAPELSLALDASAASPGTYCAGEVLTYTGRSFFTLHETAESCVGPYAGAAQADYELVNDSTGVAVRSGTVYADGNGAWHAEFGLPTTAGAFTFRAAITDGEQLTLLTRSITTTTCAPAIPPPMVPPGTYAGPSGDVSVVRFTDGIATLPWTVYPNLAIPTTGSDGSGTYGHTRGTGSSANAAPNGPTVGTTGTGGASFNASVNPANITMTPSTIEVGQPVTLKGTIDLNDSLYGLMVQWQVTEPNGSTHDLGPATWMYANGDATMVATWTPRLAGDHTIRIVIDPGPDDTDPSDDDDGTTTPVVPPFDSNTPALASLSPNKGLPDTTFIVAMSGTKLTAAGVVECGAGIAVSAFSPDLSGGGEFGTTATAQFAIDAGAALGARTCTITTEYGVGTLNNAFEVTDSLCLGVTCSTPPAGGCYAASGTCNESTGLCEYPALAAGTACDDGVDCTIGAECDGAGQCGSVSNVYCNDGKPCTTDICDPTSGCSNVSSGAECDAACIIGGDVNGSGKTNVADALCMVLTSLAVFDGGELPGCLHGPIAVADHNCDSNVNVSDVQLNIYLALQNAFHPAIDRNENQCVDTCEVPDCGNGTCDTGEECLLCGEDCGGCAGSCCEAHGTPGCDVLAVQECVCNQDPICCLGTGQWSSDCAALAPGCGATCE